METLAVIFVLLSIVLLPIAIIVWIVQAIRKCPTKKIRLTCLIILCVFIVSVIIGASSAHQHTWEDATCLTPKICSECNETEGEPTGHRWKDATCTVPKTCFVCNEIDGEAKGHVWVEATCTTPKTCSVCNQQDGYKLDHNYGEWQIEKDAAVLEKGKKIRSCSFCNDKESKSYDLSSYIKDKKFIFTPEEYRKLFFDNFVDLDYSKFGGARIETRDGQVMVSIVDNAYNDVGNIGFVANSDTWKMASSSTESGFEGAVMIVSASTEFVAKAMQCFVMSCDPTANANVAKEVAKCVLEGAFEFGGITYSITTTNDYYMMIAVVTG